MRSRLFLRNSLPSAPKIERAGDYGCTYEATPTNAILG
jgi:hypothetical protein